MERRSKSKSSTLKVTKTRHRQLTPENSPRRRRETENSPRRIRETENSPRSRRERSPSTRTRSSVDIDELEMEEELSREVFTKDSDARSLKMQDNATTVIMSWVERKANPNKNAKKTPLELVSATDKVMPVGIPYLCCETYDTYMQGGLFPILHMSTDRSAIKKLKSSNDFLNEEALGENYRVEQAIYQEIARVNPQSKNKFDYTLLSVAAFKSIEGSPPTQTLLREWKTWTGVRGCMVDIIQAGLDCHEVKFFVKEAPLNTPDGFHYIITIEVGVSNAQDEGTFIDIIQRFRVERWLGFRTVYKAHHR